MVWKSIDAFSVQRHLLVCSTLISLLSTREKIALAEAISSLVNQW
ncbi:hypothetical protein [Bacillus sp. EB01]|nr:hypothetical protein [Bacillus sp. EB01]